MAEVHMVGVRDALYYGPQIVAERLGFLADEGIELRYEAPGDPEGLAAALSDGHADVVLGGIWRPMRWALAGRPLRAFAQVNQACDFQLLSLRPTAGFDWQSLTGGTLLLTTTLAPSPWLALSELLRRKGVDLGAVRLVPAVPVAEARRLFLAGGFDAIEIEDLDAAPLLVRDDVHSLVTWPDDLGTLPWGVYYTTADRLERDRPRWLALTRALARAERWIANQDTDAIAAVVAEHVPTHDARHVRALVATYRRQRMWSPDPRIRAEDFDRWGEILVRGGWLRQTPAYGELVDDTVAEEVAHAV